MSDDLMLKCLIAFILGWFVSRHFSFGNGFAVGCELSPQESEAAYMHSVRKNYKGFMGGVSNDTAIQDGLVDACLSNKTEYKCGIMGDICKWSEEYNQCGLG